MSDLLSKRINTIQESQTLAMAQLSREMKAKGFDIINLSLGEPDFTTPNHIKEAAKTAIDNDFSFYTPVAGYLDTREAICFKLKRDNNLIYTPDQIVTSTGAKQSIINALLSTVDMGDEVIIPAPYWVSYVEMVKVGGAIPVIVNSDVSSGFKITAAALEAAITPKTKAILFSSPCNPSGAIFSEQLIHEIASVLEKHPKIVVISDEIYEYINFKSAHFSIAQIPSMYDRTIVINGLSKGFAMTGWRFGYLAAPLPIAKACIKLQGLFTSATCSITQKAAIAALTGPTTFAIDMKKAYQRRSEIVYNGLKDIAGVKPNEPDGAFYIFPDVSSFFGKKFENQTIQNAEDLTLYLMQEAHVAVVTGEAFGNQNCIRISYATSDDLLKEALIRIKKALLKLQ